MRPYDIRNFVKMFCKNDELIEMINTHTKNVEPVKRKMRIRLDATNVENYINTETDKPRKLLGHVLKYQIHNYVSEIFEHNHIQLSYDDLMNRYQMDWLYYAYRSPLWQKRIDEHSGIVDDEKKRIIFEDENKEELFFEKYNYEPDEQCEPIHILNLGEKTREQWSWRQFYMKYM